ncbi:hypothetical protein CKO42_23350 [Lamprobacter modestohalophilus]|jgi:uncharacterized protein YdeI (BOF family)|uniref:DUF5666 domain-containing protein n=1 Tax=Lamprobacter modestohalophilus TaxID=1064514 RepID=A0A9X1B6B2_9GAMM|nr:hypothetical protein [Lamprobacter modestohalophilus]MBK1621298.1 hypothetical protein [Lamprobacter modestohalophilus]
MRFETKMMACSALALALTGATAVWAEDPMTKPDDSWISVSGTVESVTNDAFVLDYGEGLMTVEMDDGDRDADGYKLVRGDKVTVNGRIDDDLFEARTLEASSVYVENIDTYFYASAVDEEDINDVIVTVSTPVVISATTVQGRVTEVGSDEFVVDTGLREVRVEVEEMAYNPLDDEGYQKIEVGDRVSVTGQIDDDLFEGRELVADSVVTLSSSG